MKINNYILSQADGENFGYNKKVEIQKTTEKLEKNQEQNMTNKVNIEFLKEQMNKVLVDIEKLKDKQRSFANGDH